MTARATIGKWGNSKAIRISKDVLDGLGLAEGDEVEYTLKPAKAKPWDVSMIPVFGSGVPTTFKKAREEAWKAMWDERHARR